MRVLEIDGKMRSEMDRLRRLVGRLHPILKGLYVGFFLDVSQQRTILAESNDLPI